MTDTSSAPVAPAADPGPPPPRPAGSDRFFSWVEGFGIVRGDAWLGGVCGGLAARLRIDPLIVRGIFVVVTLVGFPALLVYAIAWALLPDVEGRIHLRELFHGRYDSAMTGVIVLAIVGFVPVVPWLRNVLLWPMWALTGYAPWAWDDGSGVSALDVIGFVLGLALIGGLAFLIVRSARADRRARASQQASADSVPAAVSSSGDDAAATLAAAPPTGGAETAAVATSVGAGFPGDAGATGEADATGEAGATAVTSALGEGEDVAQWRATHEAWREQNDAWRRSRQDAERAAREQARQERQAAGVAFAAEAEERRRMRRATRPRTSLVFVITALGAALVAGALAALAALSDTALAGFEAAVGLLSAAVVSSLAVVVAGIARRRSGFLTAVTIVLVVVGVVTAIASGPRSLALGNVGLGTSTVPTSIVQPFGSTDIYVVPLSGEADVDAGTITVRKSTGVTYITVNPGTEVEIDARLGSGTVEVQRLDLATSDVAEVPVTLRPGEDGTSEWTWSTRNTAAPADPATHQKIVLEQALGSVYVTVYEPEEQR